MALDSAIRRVVAIAAKTTAPLAVLVTHRACISEDGDGTRQHDPVGVPVRAIVERKQRMFYTRTGAEVLSEHMLTILEPPKPNGADGRREPIDERDLFVLPDGTTAPILSIGGTVDAGTPIPFVNADGLNSDGVSQCYTYTVWLGRGPQS